MFVKKEFRERLVEELDDVFSVICQSKDYEEGLEAASDQMEEFIGMELVALIVSVLSGIEGDISKLSRELIAWREELEARRRAREKRLEEMEGKGPDGR